MGEAQMSEAEAEPVLYIVLEDSAGTPSKIGPQYARPMVQTVLTLMGVKTRYAHKVTQRLFRLLDALESKLQLSLAPRTMELRSQNGENHHGQFAPHDYTELDSSTQQLHKRSEELTDSHCKEGIEGQERPTANGHSPLLGKHDSQSNHRKQGGNSAGLNGWAQGHGSGSPRTCGDDGAPSSAQSRTPSFHARLRKGKWLADVPGPVADENGASRRGGVDETEQESSGDTRHKVLFKGLPPESPEPASASSTPPPAAPGGPAEGVAEPPWAVLRREGHTVWMRRADFEVAVCSVLRQFGYSNATQRQDFQLACRLRERRTSVTVLLCGTSGCGKSTLAALLASRLGITTVVSTDSIRHMMRSFVSQDQSPLLWASTYHAGECLDPALVARAASGKALQRMSSTEGGGEDEGGLAVTQRQMTIKGYKAQSEMVLESVDRLISAYEARRESLVIEGVHLSLGFVMGLMARHASCVPFLIYIGNEAKHLERMAVRAKYMTLDPRRNKYVKYMRNIRAIQDYLRKRAEKHLVPKVNNTNVDRSVAAIHATVFSSVRRREMGEPLLDAATNTARVVFSEYEAAVEQYTSVGSKGMLRLIRRKGSSRSLLAALHEDNPLPPTQHNSPGPSQTDTWAGSTSWGGGGPAFAEAAQGSGRIGSAGSSLGRSVERALMYGLENRGRAAESDDEEEGEEGAHSGGAVGELSDEPAEQAGEPEEGSVDGSTVASDEDASVSGGGEDALYQDTWAAGKGSGRVRVGDRGRLTTLAEQEDGARMGESEKGPHRGNFVDWGRARSSPVAVPGVDAPAGEKQRRGRSPRKSGSQWRRSQSALVREPRGPSDEGSVDSSPAGPAAA